MLSYIPHLRLILLFTKCISSCNAFRNVRANNPTFLSFACYMVHVFFGSTLSHLLLGQSPYWLYNDTTIILVVFQWLLFNTRICALLFSSNIVKSLQVIGLSLLATNDIVSIYEMEMYQPTMYGNHSYRDLLFPSGYHHTLLPRTYLSPFIFALISACAGEFIKTCLFKIFNPSYPTSLSKPSLPFKTVTLLCVYYHLFSNTFETNPLVNYITIPTSYSSILIFVVMMVANSMDIFPFVVITSGKDVGVGGGMNTPSSNQSRTTSNPTSVTTPSKYKVEKRSFTTEPPISPYSTKYD